jgi:hypothetical protein
MLCEENWFGESELVNVVATMHSATEVRIIIRSFDTQYL